MNLTFDNNIPIYIQIVEQLKIQIISGGFAAGERIPSVRDLAIKLKVNPNTLQRALLELEEMGLIFTERTNGKFVTQNEALIEKYKNEYASFLAEKYLSNMKEIGFDTETSLKYLETKGGQD